MRTKNHFCLGEGYKGFATVLSGHYPAGRVAVLCEDLAKGQTLATVLLKDYKVELFSASEEGKKKEDVRFVIGIGSPEIVPAVVRYAEDVPFAFLAETVDHRYLRGDGTRLSEFAYIDKSREEEEYYPSCYSSLFCLWCEGKIRLLEQSCFPYRDKKLCGVLDGAERVLGGECDKDEFLSESLRLISLLSGQFSLGVPLYTESVSAPDRSPEKRFVASYFLTNLLKTFTKLPQDGILNPSEERKIERVFDVSVLPDNEKMRAFAKRMNAMTRLSTTDTEDLFIPLPDCRPSGLPLLDYLCENGFLEGWKNEKFTRDRGVLI